MLGLHMPYRLLTQTCNHVPGQLNKQNKERCFGILTIKVSNICRLSQLSFLKSKNSRNKCIWLLTYPEQCYTEGKERNH